jgi:hypothetical protein
MGEDTTASLNDEYDQARAAWDLARQELWGALGPVASKSGTIAQINTKEKPTTSELERLERAVDRTDSLKFAMDTIVKRICAL